MNVKNLEIGKEYKYKELCEILCVETKSGRSKKLQSKDWERYFDMYKPNPKGQKYIVREIYDNVVEKVDGRKNNHIKHFPNFKINREDWNSIGIYAIIFNSDIYIGSTTVGFRVRFNGHRNEAYNKLDTLQMLQDGGIFVMLENCNDMSEPQIRARENFWIEEYENNDQFYVVNSRQAWSYERKPKKKYKTITVQVEEEYYEEMVDEIESISSKIIKVS